MKNEERIMEVKDMDGLLNKERVPVKKIEGSVPVVGTENKSIIPRNAKGVQSTLDQFGVEGLVGVKDVSESRKDQVEEKKYIKLNPETEEKLKKFDMEIETKDGNKETKTVVEAIEGMDAWTKDELTPEQRIDAFSKSKALMDKFMQKYDAKSPEGVELRRILSEEALGDKTQELFDLLQNKKVDVRKFAEIVGLKLDDSMVSKFEEMIKVLPLSEGVEAAPMVTVGEDGQITITPAPGEAGRGDNPSDPTSKQPSKTPENPNIRPDDVTKKEKEKFDWWKYGNAFLFLLILYFGIQGWYARIVEQMAERAR